MFRRTVFPFLVAWFAAATASAQPAPPASAPTKTPRVKLTVYADVAAIQPGKPFRLAARFEIIDGWHMYYRDPGETGQGVRFRFTKAAGLEFGEPEYPSPHKGVEQSGQISHSYSKELTLIVPVRVADDFNPAGDVAISAQVGWLVCEKSCVPEKVTISLTLPAAANTAAVAKFDQTLFDAAVAKIAKPATAADPVKVTFALNKSAVRPGDLVGAAVVLELPAGKSLPRKGLEWIVELPKGFEKFDAAKPEDNVEGGNHRVAFPAGDSFTGKVTLYTTFKAGEEAFADGKIVFRGIIQHEVSGEARRDVALEAVVASAATGAPVNAVNAEHFGAYRVPTKLGGSATPEAGTGNTGTAATPKNGGPKPGDDLRAYLASLPPADVKSFDLSKVQAQEVGGATVDEPVAVWMALGVLAGLLLNVMPCVLPVLGIKIMSFVQQAGSDPSRVWKLGVAFSLGLVLVFEILALVCVAFGLAWGEHFGKPWFILAVSVVIFTFGLSLFGVWTIRLPGSVNQLGAEVQGEGYAASFLKGMLTTVLATPCAGPWLGNVMGWALRQPPAIVFLVFTCVGIGMALPYVVLSANPKLMKFMPKPGAWMETFERAMGFVLMASVIYFLFILHGQLGGDALLATVTLLLGIAFAVWLIGVFSDQMRDVPRPAVGWIAGLAVACGTYYLAYTVIWPTPRLSMVAVKAVGGKAAADIADGAAGRLRWVPYTRARLIQLVNAGKTVHIDFTADWCPNCKFVEATVLNTEATKKIVDELNVINLKADWTDGESDLGLDIGELLKALKSGSIPVQAIFPAGDLYRPIVIRDVFSHETFAAELRRAGASKDATAKAE